MPSSERIVFPTPSIIVFLFLHRDIIFFISCIEYSFVIAGTAKQSRRFPCVIARNAVYDEAISHIIFKFFLKVIARKNIIAS